MPRQGVDFLLENPQHRRLPRPPRFNRPLGQRKRAIRHQQIRIRFWLGPQSLTSRTSPQMTVEGKMTWCQLRQPESRRRIRKRCRKPLLAPLGLLTARPVINQRPDVVRAPPQRRAHRVNQSIRSIWSNGQSINNNLHRRRMLRRKSPADHPRRLFRHQRLHLLHHPIDPQPDKTRFLQPGHQRPQIARAPDLHRRQRGQNNDPRPIRQRLQRRRNLGNRLAVNRLTRGRIMRLPARGIQHAKIIIQFRRRRYRRSRIRRADALLNRNRR